MTGVPHLAFPFRLSGDGTVAVVEQDTLDEVAQNVEVIVRTRTGTRIEIPEFGIDALLFGQVDGDDAESLLQQVARWEPRAESYAEDAPDRLDETIRAVRLTTTLSGGA